MAGQAIKGRRLCESSFRQSRSRRSGFVGSVLRRDIGEQLFNIYDFVLYVAFGDADFDDVTFLVTEKSFA